MTASSPAPAADELATARRIAVVRALPGLGDLLCAVPALRALRAAAPRATVTLVGLASARWFVQRYTDLVDELLVLPAWPGLPEVPDDAAAALAFLTEAQSRRFDLAVQLHGSGGVSNPLTALLGADRTAGHAAPGNHRPAGWFRPYPTGISEVVTALGLVRWLGAPDTGAALSFPTTAADETERAGLELAADEPYAVVHPGASSSARRWPHDELARIAEHLGRAGLTIAITGTPDEVPLAHDLAGRIAPSAAGTVVVAGATTLGALAVVVRDARVVVCNDTGVSHLAAAVATASVVLFTGTPAERWAPLDRRRHRVVDVGPGGDLAALAAAARPTVVAHLDDLTLAPSRP